MLSNMFIYLISLLAAIHGAKSQVQIDPVSCAPYLTTTRTSLTEMVDMANVAYIRTDSLTDPLTPKGELRVILNTFDVYFGSKDHDQTQSVANYLLSKSFSNKYLYC